MTPAALLDAAREGDREARGRLIEENARLIWSVVRRYTGRGVEAEDLFQLGCIGFLKAIDGFCPDYGTCFSTYAVPKIAGEMRRFLRDDGAVKVSRGLREQACRVHVLRQQLAQALGREPTVGEIAAAAGLTAEEVAAAETAGAAVVSLQTETGEGLTLESTLGTQGMEDRVLESVALREAIGQLPDRERQVILLRYFRGMTQERAARVLGVSQVQVSRIERKAVTRLRDRLAGG